MRLAKHLGRRMRGNDGEGGTRCLHSCGRHHPVDVTRSPAGALTRHIRVDSGRKGQGRHDKDARGGIDGLVSSAMVEAVVVVVVAAVVVVTQNSTLACVIVHA